MNKERVIKSHANSPAWRDMSETQRKSAAFMMLSHAYVLASIEGSKNPAITDELDRFMTDEYPGLNVDDCKMAIEMGMRGEFGDKAPFVTPANIERWIKKLATSSEWISIIEETNDVKAVDNKPSDEELNAAMYAKRPMEVYAHFLQYGTIYAKDERGVNTDAFGAVIYDHLRAHSNMPFLTQEEMHQVKRELDEWVPSRKRISMTFSEETMRDDHAKCLLMMHCFRNMIQNGLTLKIA